MAPPDLATRDTDVRDQLNELLKDLETELQTQGRWDPQAPPPGALKSTQPFAVDTLSFDQWLQWVLLPRMHELLAMQMPLPGNCAIAPMAEEVYGEDDPAAERLVVIIARIDLLLTEHSTELN